MVTVIKNNLSGIVERTALFFFAIMVFFLPISSAVIESCFGFIFVCAIIKGFIVKPGFSDIKQFFKDRINLSLLVFYIAIGISLFAAGPLWLKSFKAWFFKWGEGVLLFYFAQSFLDRRRVLILLWVLLTSSFLICVDGIYQWLVGFDFMLGFDLTKVEGLFSAVRSTFNHYNDFATYLIVIFCITIGFLLRAKNIFTKIFLFSLLAIVISNLFLTHSRGGWLALLAGLFFSLFFIPDKTAKKVIVYGALLAVALILCVPRGAMLAWEFIARGNAARFSIWQAAFRLFGESPLIGIGAGLFMRRLTEYGFEPLYGHNCYIQILTETGLIGLSAFLWFIGQVMFRAIRAIKLRFEAFSLAFLCCWFAFLTNIFFDTQLYSLKLSVFFWLLTALVSCYFSTKTLSKASTGG